MPDKPRPILGTLFWLLLGGWIGSLGYFSLVVAQAAFQVLPTSEMAGQLVDATYTPLQFYGMGAGIALAILSIVLGTGPRQAALAGLLSIFCIVSHFGVTARLDELRDRAFGAIPEAEASAAFLMWHGWSMGLLAATLLGAMLLAYLHVRSTSGAAGGGS